MTSPITRRDWEQLSAYLDDALDPRQSQKIKARLNSEADLAEAFAQLKRTRHLLRRTPQARVPRAFTLSPEMASVRENWLDRLPFSLSLVSAMATALLLFVFLGDFATPGGIVSYTNLTAPAAEADAASEATMETFALEAAPQEESLESQSGLLTEEPGAGGETPVLPEVANGDFEEGTDTADLGERLIEEQIEEAPGQIRRLHIFLVEAILALIALVSGLGAWMQRRLS